MHLLYDKITLRPATVLDTEFARSVHHAALRDVVCRQFGLWDELAQDKYFADGWQPGLFQIVLYEGDRCGYLRVETRADQLMIHEINLHPDVQNRGIGTSLLQDVLAASSKGRKPVHLQVLRENKAAGLYRELGFTEIDRNSTHIKMQYDPE